MGFKSLLYETNVRKNTCEIGMNVSIWIIGHTQTSAPMQVCIHVAARLSRLPLASSRSTSITVNSRHIIVVCSRTLIETLIGLLMQYWKGKKAVYYPHPPLT